MQYSVFIFKVLDGKLNCWPAENGKIDFSDEMKINGFMEIPIEVIENTRGVKIFPAHSTLFLSRSQSILLAIGLSAVWPA